MTRTQRIIAVCAIAFFSVLNYGTSQAEDESPSSGDQSPSSAAPAAERTFSCMRPAETRCQQYAMGAGSEGIITAESMLCQQRNGTWAQTPCPTEDLLGRCDISDSAWYFYPGEWTAADAQELCNTLSTGTWTAAP